MLDGLRPASLEIRRHRLPSLTDERDRMFKRAQCQGQRECGRASVFERSTARSAEMRAVKGR